MIIWVKKRPKKKEKFEKFVHCPKQSCFPKCNDDTKKMELDCQGICFCWRALSKHFELFGHL